MKKIALLAFVLTLLLTTLSLCVISSLRLQITYASPYTNIDVDTSYNMITNGSYPDLVALDVRTQSEYDGGHIYGAVWIPVSELGARIDELANHKDDEIIAYCESGGRSATASQILDSYNFTKVYNMLEGIQAWQFAGYPVWIATVHNLNTTFNYDTIQAAIDAPQTLEGHIISVNAGTYYENVVVNKSLTLIGENSSTTIIDGNGQYACIVHIVADDVVMSGFSMRNNRDYPGIYLENSSYCVIKYNIFMDIPRYAIYTTGAEHCRIEANNFSSLNGNWGRGIQLRYSDNSTIADNRIMTHNDQYCIWLHNSSDCKIYGNWLANGVDGLMIEQSYGCLVKKNLIENCERGIDIGWAVRGKFAGNLITSNYYGVEGEGEEWIFYHNDFINNTHQAYVSAGEGSWNNTLEGNYWDDYTGTDLNQDGIGDVPYAIEHFPNKDNYPLMGMFHSYNVPSSFGHGLAVTIISNSTVSNFSVARVVAVPVINFMAFSPDGRRETSETRFIMFNITGTTGLGFCRLCIPKALMAPPYTVIINRGPTSPIYYNQTLFDNSTHRWIYFTYLHPTTHEVWIEGQEDTTPPMIANVTQQPTEENVCPDDKVIVYADVTDLSGVKQVILNYTTNNGTWFNKEMTNVEGNIYNATIPQFPYRTNVTYVIIAEDNVDNTITTEEIGYELNYQVIPEFPLTIITFFMITTLLAVIVYRSKHPGQM